MIYGHHFYNTRAMNKLTLHKNKQALLDPHHPEAATEAITTTNATAYSRVCTPMKRRLMGTLCCNDLLADLENIVLLIDRSLFAYSVLGKHANTSCLEIS